MKSQISVIVLMSLSSKDYFGPEIVMD